MIAPRNQWCHQVSVTSVCWPKTPSGQLTGCSNCTRLLAHERKRYVMSPDDFETCVRVARDFVYRSPPDHHGRQNKVIGIFGGEPLMTPHFATYCEIMIALIPEAKHRGLWTSLNWREFESPKWGRAAPLVERLIGFKPGQPPAADRVRAGEGFLNWNMHEETNLCEHHSTLTSVSFIVQDPVRRWQLIDQCWLNRDWSACYAYDSEDQPKFYFCEIAASMDRVMRLGTGLPVEPGVWNGDLRIDFDYSGPEPVAKPGGPYARQLESSCLKCGHPVPFKRGRRDLDFRDDVTPDNLVALQVAGSPMVARGDTVTFTEADREQYDEAAERSAFDAGRYIKSGVVRSSVVRKAVRNRADVPGGRRKKTRR